MLEYYGEILSEGPSKREMNVLSMKWMVEKRMGKNEEMKKRRNDGRREKATWTSLTWCSFCSTEIGWTSASAPLAPRMYEHSRGVLCGPQFSVWGSFPTRDRQLFLQSSREENQEESGPDDKDKNKDSVDSTRTGQRQEQGWTLLERLLEQEGGSKGKHKPKNANAHNLDSKPSIAEPEIEIDEFSMTYFNVDELQESEKMRGSEWIKIGVDTGAGKTAWPQTYGTTIPGDSDLTFRTAPGELVKGGKRMQIVGCDDW